MKAHIPMRLTNKEQKALENEIKKQCVETTEKYELDIDTVTIWVLHTKFGFGIKRITEFYHEMFSERKKAQEFYKSENDEDIAEFAMRYKLKQDGIDVEKLHRDNKDNRRFTAVLK